MWQVLYNDSYVMPMPSIYPTHTTPAGQMLDAGTPLAPFFANDTSFWTSDTIRDHEVFGYTYPEVVGKNRSEVVTAINRLYTRYSPATMSTKRRRRRSIGYGNTIVADGGLNQHNTFAKSLHLPLDAVFDGDDYYEWIANIHVNKHALSGSFFIHLFLGDVPEDSSTWPIASNLVGTLGIFAHSGPHGNIAHQQVAGTIPMTSTLMNLIASGQVESLRPAHIEPFLRSQLKVRITVLEESIMDPKEVDGLGISVISSRVRAPSSEDTLAKWGETTSHFDLSV